MLIDPIFKETIPPLRIILDTISGGQLTRKIETGVYSCGHWSFDQYLAQAHDKWPELPDGLNAFGVADDLANIKEVYKVVWELPERQFVLAINKILKAEQPADGGWRWHKWGPYVGKMEPKHEYLFDESDYINDVYTFHFYELLDNALLI